MSACCVGNDIVDLADLDGQLKNYDARFVSRVCTKDEMSFLISAEKSEETFWKIWTAKETAFKIYQRLHARARFQPRNFKVNLQSCTVTHAGMETAVAWSITRDYVFCSGRLKANSTAQMISSSISVTKLTDHVPIEELTELELRSAQTPESCSVRILAKNLLAQTLHLNRQDIEIVRRPMRQDWSAPEIRYKGRILNETGLSLTHHGRFQACTISFSQ